MPIETSDSKANNQAYFSSQIMYLEWDTAYDPGSSSPTPSEFQSPFKTPIPKNKKDYHIKVTPDTDLANSIVYVKSSHSESEIESVTYGSPICGKKGPVLSEVDKMTILS